MKKILLSVAACTLIGGVHAAITRTATVDNSVRTENSAPVTSDWIVINLEAPGILASEIWDHVSNLSEVVNLRITGTLNSGDWQIIKSCDNLTNFDLSGAHSSSMPARQFERHSAIRSVILPGNMKTMGSNAFYDSSVVEVTFPASFETFEGTDHFNYSKLEKLDLSSCKLTAIPPYTFRNCYNLTEVKLPETLVTIGANAFSGCRTLSAVDFPAGLQTIGSDAFNSADLKVIELPATLRTLGSYAFANNKNTTELQLPATISEYAAYVFQNCAAITRVTCLSPVPPAIINGTFSLTTANADLIVPTFALNDYKSDVYWHGFKSISGGATSDLYSVNGRDLVMTDKRRFDGQPSLTLGLNSSLTVSGPSAMPLNVLRLEGFIEKRIDYVYQSQFGQLLNLSPAVTARRTEVALDFEPNKWYFITLPFDVKAADVKGSDSAAEFVIRYYDGAKRAEHGTDKTRNWVDVAEDGILKAGRGYIFQTNKATKFVFAADGAVSAMLTPNTITIDLAANAADNAADAGWNYIGNPWPTYYDMAHSMLTCPVTIWDGINSKYVAYSMIDDDLVLRPFQSFFIQASEEMNLVEFGTSGRRLTETVESGENAPARSAMLSDRRSLFNLSVRMGDKSDNTRVVINEEASADYEAQRDASKFFSEAAVPQLYTVDTAGNALAINERPEADGKVQLGFYAPHTGTMTINADRIDGAAQLIDNATGKTVTLRKEESYTFEVENAGYNTDRFTLLLTAATPSGVDSVAAENDGPVYVYSMTGAFVGIFDDLESMKLTPGIYLLKTAAKTEKRIIR